MDTPGATRPLFLATDRAALADMVDRYSLEQVVRELSHIWDERSEALKASTAEWSDTMVKRAIADELAEDIAKVVNDARILLRVKVREAVEIAEELGL